MQFISAVCCCTPPRSSPLWVATRGDDLRSMLHTATIFSAVCCTPLRCSLWCVQRSSPRCDAHRGDYLRGMLYTAEIISAVCCTLQRSSLWCIAHCRDNFVIKYLNEIETEFEIRKYFSLFIRGPYGFES